MLIRRSEAKDRPAVRRLAERLGLDYPGMEDDPFWIAEADGAVIATCGLKQHPDSREFCAVGVAEEFRGRGTATALIAAVLAEVSGDIYLATIKPEVFASLGFVPAPTVPRSLKTRPVGWCDGCEVARCAVLVRRGR